MTLIDKKAFYLSDRFVSAIPELNVVLNDPTLKTLAGAAKSAYLKASIQQDTALLSLPAESIGKALVATFLFLQIISESKSRGVDKSMLGHLGSVKTVMHFLHQQGFILTPEDAEVMFEQCLNEVFKYRVFAKSVDAAIAGGRGEGNPKFLAVMRRIANIDLLEAVSDRHIYGPTFTQSLAAALRALKTIGGRSEQHPAILAMKQGEQAEAEIRENLKEAVHPLIVAALSETKGRDRSSVSNSSPFWKELMDQAKGFDRAERSKIFEDAFFAGEYLENHPYFQTLVGAKCTTFEQRIDFHTRWRKLEEILIVLSKKQLDISEARALWLIDQIQKNWFNCKNAARPTGGKIALLGTIKIHKPSLAFFRSIAAALPKRSAPLEIKVRDLELKAKEKNILLEAVSRIDPSEDMDGQQRAAIRDLEHARQKSATIAPDVSAGKPPSFGSFLKNWFSKPKAQQNDVATMERYGLTALPVRQLFAATIKAMRCGIDVRPDIIVLENYFESTVKMAREMLAQRGPLENLDDVYALRQQIGMGVIGSREIAFAREVLEMQHHLHILQSLSEYQHEICARIMISLLPISTGIQPNATWIAKADEFADHDVEELVAKILGEFRPPDIGASYHFGSEWHNIGAGFYQEADFIIALIWLAGRMSAGLAGQLEVIADLSFEEIKSVGPRASRFGNATFWALSQLPGGAGADGLQRLAASITYPSARARAIELLKSYDAGTMDVASIAEKAAIDHGLVTGPREEHLELGSVRISYQAPDQITVTWMREDGKEGKVPTPAMRKADPEGIKRIKRIVKTIETDLADLSEWMETLWITARALPFSDWKVRYLDHGTLGPLARGLIWKVQDGPAFMVDNDALIDAKGKAVAIDDAHITLWHPLHSAAKEVSEWRKVMFERGITQPFAQVWRETYSLGDKENTDLFAGHIVMQKAMRTHLTKMGWSGKACSDKSPVNPMVLHFPATDLAVLIEFSIPNGAPKKIRGRSQDYYLQLGKIRAIKLSHGAKPSTVNLKKGKAVALDALSDISLSEVLRQTAQTIEETNNAREINNHVYEDWTRTVANPYRSAFLKKPGLALFDRRCEVLDAMIAKHGLKTMSRDGILLKVQGDIALYHINIVTFSIHGDAENDPVYFNVSQSLFAPGVPLPHGRDARLFKILGIAQKLLDDKRMSKEDQWGKSLLRHPSRKKTKS